MAEQTFSGEIQQCPSPPNYIGRLLGEDWFLRRVLSCLIDDGLHECRRVCREWNAVCKTLPVKLRGVPPEHLRKVLSTFPDAVEVSCTSCFLSNELGVARHLAGMSSLKHLDGLVYSYVKHSDDLQFIYAEAYTRLQSLRVCLNSGPCDNFRNALPCLTGLRKLVIRLTWVGDVDPTLWSPFTELEGLCELELCDRLLKNGRNQILFPSTSLTKLIVHCGEHTDISTTELLATVGRYAGTLRSLSLYNTCVRFLEPSRAWTALQCFGRLEVLEMGIEEVETKEFLNSFFSVVATIGTLRSLALATDSYPRYPIDDVFCSLTNLQSLGLLFVNSAPGSVSVSVSQLTRLTSLALEGVAIQGSIVPLNELASLSLDYLPSVSEDLSSALTQLTKLTELEWVNERLPALPNHVLSQLKRLRRLILCTRVDLDLEFFQSLASLSDLTSLFCDNLSKQGSLDSIRMQFTVLTQLQELELYCGRTKFDVVGLFAESSFPRLRHLAITNPKMKENEERLLFKRFPCLRSYTQYISVFRE